MSVPMKLESIPDTHVKMEPPADTPSPYMDDIDEVMEEGGDLDFNQAQQQFWLSHLPRSLWEALSQAGDNDEIDLGTIRLEGSITDPKRISLLLNKELPSLRLQHKEYNLLPPPPEKVRSKEAGSAFVFSEKDVPGYKSKTFGWDDVDEDGNPGQGRSYLYEKTKRELKKKENKGRFVPYNKRPIPKQTAIAGTITKEFEATPVKSEEYFELEAAQAKNALRIPEKKEALFAASGAGLMQGSGLLTMSDRAAINKASQARKQTAKESRAARIEKPDLINRLTELFRQHRVWKLRDLKAKVQQPESYLKEVLEEIAFTYKSGDFVGGWELKDEYKGDDSQLLSAGGIGKAESDLDPSGMDDDDDEAFEDV